MKNTSKKIKSTNIEWILSLVERDIIEFVGEPVQTENGFEYTFRIIDNEEKQRTSTERSSQCVD